MPDESPPVPPAPAAVGPRAFLHDLCRATTEMPADQVRGRLENPHGFNDWVYCAKCDGYVARRECRWADSGENLGEFFDRAKAAVPPPSESKLIYLAPAVLAVLGWLIGGFVLDGGKSSVLGLVIGFALGAVLLVLRKYGLK